MSNLVLVAPMQGWSAPLDEVPDALFAGRLLGDGQAIDPTGASLYAPCDGEIVTVPAQKHAITLRAPNGAEILLHVGIDTVALGGEGFDVKVHAGARVKAGDLLLTFDMDLLARRAKSLLTPIVITDAVPFSIVRRASDRAVKVGDFLMELAPASSVQGVGVTESPATEAVTARVVVGLEHGIHARPAALFASRVKNFAATVTVSVRGRSANARSAIGLMSLGVRKGEEISIAGVGPDATSAVAALKIAIEMAVDEVGLVGAS
ncbi:MAG: glucose PTS transporter subunit IIA, partial [Gammaproteobacteria bacterium]